MQFEVLVTNRYLYLNLFLRIEKQTTSCHKNMISQFNADAVMSMEAALKIPILKKKNEIVKPKINHVTYFLEVITDDLHTSPRKRTVAVNKMRNFQNIFSGF